MQRTQPTQSKAVRYSLESILPMPNGKLVSHKSVNLWFGLSNTTVSLICCRNLQDHFQHFQTNGFGVIEPNRTFFRLKYYICYINYILGIIYLLCNAPIRKLKEILISSLQQLEEIYIIFQNSTHKSLPTLLCGLQAARF